MASLHISTECVDNRDGRIGVVVYGDKTFPMSFQQGIASVDGRGSHSSVRVFQWPSYEVEGTNMERGPPETAGDSHSSLEEEDEELKTTTAVKNNINVQH